MIFLTPVFMVKLLQVVITVFIVGQPPIVERLPTLYKNNDGSCEKQVADLKAKIRENVDATIDCEETDDRQG